MTLALNPNRAQAAGGHYRADIDGLRALAVLAVVLYHFGIAPFSGGFVGVDVFFVISGFLITSLIRHEMERDEFSFVSFYERRIRRIFPALVAMLLVVSLAALIWLLPGDLIRYDASLIATALFGSNFEFVRKAGYFDVASELKPLLHTWSLAVEEQFYLLFPLVLFLSRRAARTRLLAIIGLLLVASLAWCVWETHARPAGAFYLLPSRLWELMLGAILAIGAWSPPSRLAGAIATMVGLPFIGIAVFGYDTATPFPGFAALLPCLGTALVIYAGASPNRANAALGVAPLVWVGLLSYSLYLWHWPVLAFAKYLMPQAPGAALKVALILLSFGLAWLSWRYVERPFRRRSEPIPRRTLFGGAVAAILGLIVIGFVPRQAGGLPQRFPEDVQRILAADTIPFLVPCADRSPAQIRRRDLCRLGADTMPHFLLWGDSHAGALASGVDEVARRRGIAGFLITNGACAPFEGVTPGEARRMLTACPRVNAEAARLAADPSITLVILVGRWAINAEGTGFHQQMPARFLADAGTSTLSVANNHAVFERGLRRTIADLVGHGKEVVLVGPVPEIGARVPTALALAKLHGVTSDFAPSRDEFLARQAFVLRVLERLGREFPITVIYPDHVLCAGPRCEIAEKSGLPLYADQHHLNPLGAARLEPMLDQALR